MNGWEYFQAGSAADLSQVYRQLSARFAMERKETETERAAGGGVGGVAGGGLRLVDAVVPAVSAGTPRAPARCPGVPGLNGLDQAPSRKRLRWPSREPSASGGEVVFAAALGSIAGLHGGGGGERLPRWARQPTAARRTGPTGRALRIGVGCSRRHALLHAHRGRRGRLHRRLTLLRRLHRLGRQRLLRQQRIRRDHRTSHQQGFRQMLLHSCTSKTPTGMGVTTVASRHLTFCLIVQLSFTSLARHGQGRLDTRANPD